jgi:DnaK suppressor protein
MKTKLQPFSIRAGGDRQTAVADSWNKEGMFMSETIDKARLEALRAILTLQRDAEYAKVRDFRRDQTDEALSVPSDDLEVARSLADIEMHASLIERSEERLKAIDAAFTRLEQNRYGLCEQCGSEISLERLRALPFATCCIDCQEKRESRRSALGAGSQVDEPFLRRWRPPEEYEDSVDDLDKLKEPEEDLTIRESAFGPEEGELEELPSAPVRRGRRRKAAS